MKKYLLISLLALSSATQARITQEPNVSVTAATVDTDNVAKGNSYIYGWDDAGGVNRRIQVNSSGQMLAGGGQPAWTVVSHTTRTITAPTMLNLTNLAGSSGIMMVTFGSSNSNSSGVYWTIEGSSTYTPPRFYYATSTTPIAMDYLVAGTHLSLSPASATDISNTVDVLIQKLSVVAP